ncbi:M24 family metallopeptidase [Mesorhizobium sp. M4B.F.Ca.ET.190.01.1.1]|uniref:M24 family metallopeptidase n=1 Tax=unclassified Mesorhizobium TaxID=325217 RepID=UPI001092E3D5|nr:MULTISPECIES: M24 family metallopeptidase [unclassified Mesorhizobium]TGR15134.1 M24 family metallopeptidase [Mesorhizobium sp. M4B.F.Ca.ET.200.01.1.1]TGS23008.1 M24 family metallopeptidase [Mesorhizobium sp. M4B.F.Ca.ET.190.01.1.1]TGT33844.1 M24 family metallopeptidase [Mesorhizobium sp. M4B.F.Ca.ET.172.01.1.1]
MMQLPFAISEYQSRLLAIRKELAQRGLDLLIVNDVANQHYITGYDGWSFYTPQVVLVPLADEEPVWIGRAMDAAGGLLTAWMKPENVVGFPEDHVQRSDRHPMDWIASWIERKGWGRGNIGIELEAYYYSPKAHARLTAGLPNATFRDADLLVNWIRSVKSDGEIGYLRKAARLAEAAVSAAYEVIAPGVRECDAIASIQAAQIAGSPDFAGDITALPPTILGGENASAPHIMWSDRRFGDNETVALELAGVVRRYAAGLARTLQLGAMPAKVSDTSKAVLEGMEAVLAAIKPGAAAEDVEASWRKVIQRYGLKKESRIGYSIGAAYPPDWGEHTISLRQGDKTILKPGNVLHSILGMWMDGWGIEVSETILVTANGCETLTQFPREIHVKC